MRCRAPGESLAEFKARLVHSGREQRDADVDALRKRWAPKLQTLQNAVQRAQKTLADQQSQASGQTLDTVVTVGTTLLGAFLGRKTVERHQPQPRTHGAPQREPDGEGTTGRRHGRAAARVGAEAARRRRGGVPGGDREAPGSGRARCARGRWSSPSRRASRTSQWATSSSPGAPGVPAPMESRRPPPPSADEPPVRPSTTNRDPGASQHQGVKHSGPPSASPNPRSRRTECVPNRGVKHLRRASRPGPSGSGCLPDSEDDRDATVDQTVDPVRRTAARARRVAPGRPRAAPGATPGTAR